MQSSPTTIAGALLFTQTVHADARGTFRETFRLSALEDLGLSVPFVQENVSESSRGVLRGLHHADGMIKLTQLLLGETYHVLADMRPDSPTYRRWQAFRLTHRTPAALYVPAGVANGFYVLSDHAIVHYKQSRYYDPAIEHRVRWNEPALGIEWPSDAPRLSPLDRDVPDLPR